MNKTAAILIVIILVVGGFVYYTRDESSVDLPENITRNGEEWTRYKSDEFGFGFEYRAEPNGYIVVDQDESQVPQGDTVEFLSIFNEADYTELMASSVPRDGPPAISILVFNNPNNYSPRAWAEKETVVSNITIARSDIVDTTIAGAPAIRFLADGLYTNEIIIASHKGRIYLIYGGYPTEDSPIRRDFLEMLNYFLLY